MHFIIANDNKNAINFRMRIRGVQELRKCLGGGGVQANADKWVEKGQILYTKTLTKGGGGGGGGVEINEKNTHVILERP